MGRAAGKPRVNSSLSKEVRWVQENYGNATSSDQIVDLLRANFPKYNRQKLPTITKMVEKILDSNNKSKQKFTRKYNDDGDSTSSPVRKKAKKNDNREQNELQSDYSSSESQSDDGDEDRRAILTSEDDVSDLTKLMLRNKYSSGVEFEVVTNSNNKETKVVDLVKGANKAQKPNNLSNIGVGDDGPRFKDIGGMDAVLNELLKGVIIPLYHPELPGAYGVRPTGGILLHGPPGCGKTTLAHAIANELGFPFYKASNELVSGISGASEENIRELFSKAYRTAPSVVFIDEIDSIASKRENSQREMERRIVTQLMTCMDQSHRVSKPDDTSKNLETSNNKPGHVLVIGATNRPDVLDSALRRPGRFDREIALGVPDENARFQILKVLTRHLTLEGDFDLMKISRMTPGFVAADLLEVVNVAGNLAMRETIDKRELEFSKESEQNEGWWRNAWWTLEELKKRCITMLDFERAVKLVQASSKREGFSSIPNVKWEDVGGLDSLRREFDLHIVRRIKYQDEYEEYGVDLDTGFLLYGPPGCGKTLIAKAVANEAGANFIHIKGPEILSKYVGKSESAVRTIFSRARACSPCILFFDEIDAMTTNRGKEGGSVVQGLVNQLLVELDGADQRKGVYVIGATNRPDVMDQALIRPGRMGNLLYVPLPNQDERVAILKALARNKPLDADVDLIAIAQMCANFSGADLADLMYKASVAALEERFNKIEAGKATDEPRTIKAIHFKQALEKMSPSVSDEQIECFHRLSKHYRA